MYPWLMSSWLRFAELKQKGKLPHAILVSGAHQLGGAELAHQWASLFLCEQPVQEKPCGHCHACHLMQQHSHPDCHVFGGKEQKTIGVDAIRQLIQPLQKSAQLGIGKVVILDQAERMTEAAENALLKTLEEPPGNSLLILLTDIATRLLPTIVSRCQLWTLSASREQVRSWFQEQHPELTCSEGLLNAYQDAPLALVQQLQNQSELPAQQISQLVITATEKPWELVSSARKLAEQWGLLYPWLVRCVLDTLKYQQQVPASELSYAEYPDLLKSLARWPAVHHLESLDRLQALQASLQDMPSSIPSLLILNWLEYWLGRPAVE